MAEQVVGQSPMVLRWPGPKRKATVFSAKHGVLVLTDERLLFLAVSNQSAATQAIAALGGRVSGTLDSSEALAHPGSLAVPLERIEQAELKGMFAVLTVTYRDEAGAVAASTFAMKNAGMPDGPAWVRSIEELARRRQA